MDFFEIIIGNACYITVTMLKSELKVNTFIRQCVMCNKCPEALFYLLMYDIHAYAMLTVGDVQKMHGEEMRLKFCFENQDHVLRFGQQRAKQTPTKI